MYVPAYKNAPAAWIYSSTFSSVVELNHLEDIHEFLADTDVQAADVPLLLTGVFICVYRHLLEALPHLLLLLPPQRRPGACRVPQVPSPRRRAHLPRCPQISYLLPGPHPISPAPTLPNLPAPLDSSADDIL